MNNIKRLSINDYDNIIELWNKSDLPTRPTGRDSLESMTKQFKNDCFAMYGIKDHSIKDKNKLCAVVMITDDSRRGWINRLCVLPEYRGKGYAKKLIQFSEEYLKDRGIEIFVCLIEDYNKASQNLFKGSGYTHRNNLYYFTKRGRDGI